MITIKDEDSLKDYIQNQTNEDGFTEYTFSYPCSSPTSCFPYEIAFTRGVYFLECWGASGTVSLIAGLRGEAGSGGYSSGLFIPKNTKTLYLHIGWHQEQVSDGYMDGNYNGQFEHGSNENDGAGGGATDFRTTKGPWNKNFKSRILVAGGGGAGRVTMNVNENTYMSYPGGNGGGITGEPGFGVYCNSTYGMQNGSSKFLCENTIDHKPGKFGYSPWGGWSSGGGGWYGGGSVAFGSGGGGSGYVGNLIGIGKYNAITKASDHVGFGQAKISIIPEEKFLEIIFQTYQNPTEFLHLKTLCLIFLFITS